MVSDLITVIFHAVVLNLESNIIIWEAFKNIDAEDPLQSNKIRTSVKAARVENHCLRVMVNKHGLGNKPGLWNPLTSKIIRKQFVFQASLSNCVKRAETV